MTACVLCSSEPASVEVAVESGAGDVVALPARIRVGTACLSLMDHGADEELAVRLSGDYAEYGRENVVATLRRGARGRTPVAPEPSSVLRARDEGFVGLAEHTGAELGLLWPNNHRRELVETDDRSGDPDDAGDRWFVTSPWPLLSVPEVLTALWQWVERDPYPRDEQSGLRAWWSSSPTNRTSSKAFWRADV